MPKRKYPDSDTTPMVVDKNDQQALAPGCKQHFIFDNFSYGGRICDICKRLIPLIPLAPQQPQADPDKMVL